MTLHGDALVPLARAADITGLTYATIYGAGLRGHLRLRRMGRRIFVPLQDLEELTKARGAVSSVRKPPIESVG